MRRAKQSGFTQRRASRGHESLQMGVPTMLVIHGVPADGVTSGNHFLQKCWMPLSLGAQHKERRRHVVCLELVQHPKRDGWIRTVVKRQMHSI